MAQLMSGGNPGAPQFYANTLDENNPEWGKWFDALNAAAPGGITNRGHGLPGQNAMAPLGSPMDPVSRTYDPQMLARLSMAKSTPKSNG